MKAMQKAAEQLCDAPSSQSKAPALLKDLRATIVQFDAQSKSVSVTTAASPPGLQAY